MTTADLRPDDVLKPGPLTPAGRRLENQVATGISLRHPPTSPGNSMSSSNSQIPWTGPRADALAVIGHVTRTEARLWFCTPRASGGPPPEVFVFEARDELPPARDANDAVSITTIAPVAESGWTSVVQLSELDPGTTYRVGVRLDGEVWVIGEDVPCTFRTDPAESDRVRFGLVSCHDPYRSTPVPAQLEAWDVLHDALRPQEDTSDAAVFLIAGGDQVYSDADPKQGLDIPALIAAGTLTVGSPELLDEYRELYHRHWAFDEVRRVYGSVPTYMMWDDHDIFDGWGSQLESSLQRMFGEASRAQGVYEAARQTFCEFQADHNPSTDDGRTDDGLDFSFSKGGARIFVLDGRSCRDRANNGVILGDAQIARFQRWVEGLADSGATSAFVVSAVPVVHLAGFAVDAIDVAKYKHLDDDLYDEWDHPDHTAERDRWLKPLFAAAHKLDIPAVVLSGDVHVGAAFKMECKEYPGAAVYQVTSSAIAQPGLQTGVLTAGVAPSGALPVAPDGGFHVLFELMTPVIEGNNCALFDIEPGVDGALGTGVCTFWERTATGDVLEHSRLVLWGEDSGWTSQIAKRTRRITDNDQREAATALLRAHFGLTRAGWDRIRDDRTVVDVGPVDLSGLDFVGFDLSGIDLRAAKIGRGGLCGADLEAAELPDQVAEYGEVLDIVETQSEQMRRLFILLATGCGAAALATWQLPHGAFVPHDAMMAEIPLVGIAISAHMFIPSAVLALGLLLIYFANESAVLLTSLRRLPLRFASGSWLHEAVHPWVTTRMFARALERRVEPKREIWTGAAVALSGFLLWLIAGFALVAIWRATYLDFELSAVHLGWMVVLGTGVGLGTVGISRFASLIRNPRGAVSNRAGALAAKGLSRRYGYAGSGTEPKTLRLGVFVALLFTLGTYGMGEWRYRSEAQYPLVLEQQELAGFSLGDERHLQSLRASGAQMDGVRFEGLTFVDARFDQAALANADFVGATIRDSLFASAELRAAEFSEATISRTRFENATLPTARFDGARLSEETRFISSNLERSVFSGATIEEVNFEATSMSFTDLGESTIHDSWFRAADLTGAAFDAAEVERTIFDGANMVGAQFGAASIEAANFRSADLSRSSFERATLINSQFLRAGLGAANFDSARIMDSPLDGATLSGATFREAIIQGTSFAGADLAGVSFEGASLNDVDFRGAVLAGANFAGATLTDVRFTDAEMPNARFHEANLDGVGFDGATVVGSSFEEARFTEVRFVRTDAREINLGCREDSEGCDEFEEFPDQEGARLYFRDSDFSGARFSDRRLGVFDTENSVFDGANFERTQIAELRGRGCDFQGASFERATIADAELERADLNGANFTGASVTRARIERANFSGAIMTGADFAGSYGTRVDFSFVEARCTNLQGTSLGESSFRGADMEGAMLHTAELMGGNFTDANLARALIPDPVRLGGTTVSGTRAPSEVVVDSAGRLFEERRSLYWIYNHHCRTYADPRDPAWNIDDVPSEEELTAAQLEAPSPYSGH